MVKSDFVDKKDRMGKVEEEKFRQLFKNIKCYILRIPDYATTGIRSKSPSDFLVIYRGKSYMFEVKHTYSLTSISFDQITEQQLISLRQHKEKGDAESYVVFFNPKGIWIVDVGDIIFYMTTSNRKSIPFTYIKEHGISSNVFIENLIKLDVK